ncbi:MAG: hypothetical protein EZS28_051606 [Streblomastix strix]|uniref:Uncharacterized protein n=1 Tax=Streblomastix strix TaxID=222440 RepID=A0A5J4T3H6_9EUKA|nr:MAG: hypothetical protein EZS28_051606 [Streblomastix strix]
MAHHGVVFTSNKQAQIPEKSYNLAILGRSACLRTTTSSETVSINASVKLPPKCVKWKVYQAPETLVLAIKILRRARFSDRVAAGVVDLQQVSQYVIKTAKPVLRVVLPPEPAYLTYFLRRSQFPAAMLR